MEVGVYIIGTLVLSVVSDFTSKSTHYLARPDNLLNLYFVKFSWGWTLLLTSAFVFVTSRWAWARAAGYFNLAFK